jgi:hypothetical protein
MSSELIRVPAAWLLTERERVSVEALLASCGRSIDRRLPPTLMLVALDVELERVALQSRPPAEQGDR